MHRGDLAAEEEAQAVADYASNFIRPDENPVEPASVLVYPVIKDIDLMNIFKGGSFNGNHTIEATISGFFYW